PVPNVCSEEPLYFRRNNGVCKFFYASDHIEFCGEGGVAEFDTYFNSFSLEKWMKYTIIDNVSLSLDLQGKFLVTIVRKYRSGRGREVLTEVLAETIVEEWQRTSVKIPINFKHTTGLISFRIMSLNSSGMYFGGFYLTEIETKKIREVKIGINICTYKREKFVINNLQKLRESFFANPQSEMNNHCEVFVTDNAKTLDCKELENEKIHIFPNKNVGGSGGFTRGLIEIAKRKESDKFTHALFMDDDIVLDPEVVLRTYSILTLVNAKYAEAFIGGSMLRLDNQYLCHESGGYWDRGAIKSLKKGLDLRDAEACIYNEYEEATNYNAWWYCAVPLSKVSESNLPLPIFIKADDVEYGLRNMRYLILMNGICVWHEPFENKYSSMQWYYILRNQCIVNSIYSLFKKKQFYKEFENTVLREIFWYRYKNAELIMRGVNDFLKGIDWLKVQDGEALNKEIINSGYKMQSIDELSVPFSYPEYERMSNVHDKNQICRFFRRLSFNGLFMKPRKKYSYASATNTRSLQCYRAKKVLNYDEISHTGFVTEKNFEKSISLLLQYFRLKCKFKRKARKIMKGYKNRFGEITNLTFWNNYLNI
ncbi:MAG TPA: glycosyltransferase, partial [Clostridia bacterium]|nr:glycosyltransferase [Clostridia bacterium]